MEEVQRGKRNVGLEKRGGKFWKKKALPAAPHPHQHRLTSPSLQQAAMMAGAEEGRGAILSTHTHEQGSGSRSPTPWNVVEKYPWR